MNKQTIITILLAIVAMAGQAQTPKDSCSIPKDSPIAVGTGTWGIAAVIPKYMSLRLPEISLWGMYFGAQLVERD